MLPPTWILLILVGLTFSSRLFAGKGAAISQRIENVRTTAYTYGAAENGKYSSWNALGQPLKAAKVKSAAADWSRWPVGTRFVVLETGQEYIVDDYGSAMVGTGTIDLFKPTAREMNGWGVRHVTIEVIEWGSPESSLRILMERKRLRYIREMVEDLQAQT